MATKATPELMNEFCEIIDTYSGRDKVMKALCYSAKLIAGYYATRDPVLYKRYATISSQISGARATLRLIDDIPMIQEALEYGLGKKESDDWTAFLSVTTNIVDLLFYPVEKICWLSDHNIIKFSERWDSISSAFWTLSVYLNLMRAFRIYSLNRKRYSSSAAATQNGKSVDDTILKKQRLEVLTLLRLSLDLVHAGSTLPKGYLWGGKLSTLQVGALGTCSAAIGIYQIFAKRKLNRK